MISQSTLDYLILLPSYIWFWFRTYGTPFLPALMLWYGRRRAPINQPYGFVVAGIILSTWLAGSDPCLIIVAASVTAAVGSRCLLSSKQELHEG